MTRTQMIDFIITANRHDHDYQELDELKLDLECLTDSELEELGEATHYELMTPPELDDDPGDYGHFDIQI